MVCHKGVIKSRFANRWLTWGQEESHNKTWQRFAIAGGDCGHQVLPIHLFCCCPNDVSLDSKRCERLNYFQYTPIRSISSMLIEPGNCAMMVGGQDGQLSAAHISPWQSISSSQFPPPFCLWRTLLDLKVAEIIPLPTPWLCHCVLMKGSDRGGVTSSKDCLLAFWQIALCGQERGQVARVSFGEAHWTAGGWSTGCGGDWECFPRGTPWSQPFSGVKVDGQL